MADMTTCFAADAFGLGAIFTGVELVLQLGEVGNGFERQIRNAVQSLEISRWLKGLGAPHRQGGTGLYGALVHQLLACRRASVTSQARRC